MTESDPPEPSMDEILASIRRIISEDAAAVDDGDEVLVLRERAPTETFADDPSPAREPAVVADDHPSARHNALAVAPPPAAASFERLYFVVENTPTPPPVAVSASGPTLEDLTKELLKPMVKAWLDENLDAIVRARVDEEVERIARGRVR